MLGVEHAYCLCLDKREEHWEDLKEQCESKGIKFHPFIVGDGDITFTVIRLIRFIGCTNNPDVCPIRPLEGVLNGAAHNCNFSRSLD